MKDFFHNVKVKNLLILLAAAFVAYTVYDGVNAINENTKNVSLSEFIKMNDQRTISEVQMTTESISGTTKQGQKFRVSYPVYYSPKLIDELTKHGAKVNFLNPNQERGGASRFINLLGNILSWLPIAFMLWLMYTTFKGVNSKNQNQSGGGIFGGPFSFSKNKAKMISAKELGVTFKDVAGIDEAKEDLVEIVDFLRDPQKYQKIGGRIPKGCLLVGSPGTGKTLLAKAIASEAGVPFFFISGSDFVEMFVGVGASRVRDMFMQAKKHAPCIIFIDEIDAVGRHRGVGIGGGNDEREQTLNQLLVEMDGFEENNGIVLVAATNRPDVLDPALLRPGRFDRQIHVPLPDVSGRQQILDVHMKKIIKIPSIDSHVIARGTPGFSGAELANLVNEAALLAARRNKNIVTSDEFEEARDKILMGTQRKTIIKKEERELTAYHEGGHALVALNMPASDPIHKATIIPRGRALGLVMRLPEGDRFSITREKMYADICVGLAGRIAEELTFGYDKVTSGASSDIEMVTKMARSMVIEWGLSDKIGPVNYKHDKSDSYAPSSHAFQCSEEMAKLIDSEVKRIIDESYIKTKEILINKKDDLRKIAEALIEFETLTGAEIASLIEGRPIIRTVTSVESGKSVISSMFNKENNNPENE